MAPKIAEERIERLFELAGKRVEQEERQLADRYVELALRIGTRYNISIPSELKKKFCGECKSYLVPGENCRVRINSKKNHVNYCCMECGNVDRYGF